MPSAVSSHCLTRRRFVQHAACLALSVAWLNASNAQAAVQSEETLADDVASLMRSSINHASPARLVFASEQEGKRWLAAMSQRLQHFIADEYARERILVNVQYESSRAGLDTQLVLALIEVESAFRQYAMSSVGARGLMQVMPFWQRHIGKAEHNLFDIRTNLRYGCTILRHYQNRENGNIRRALARFNGSLGRDTYPNAVFAAWRKRWQWNG